MCKQRVPILVLVLGLAGLVIQCEASWFTKKKDALTILNDWLIEMPNHPGTAENPDKSLANFKKFIRGASGSVELKDNPLEQSKVKEFVRSIESLDQDPNRRCTYTNLLATAQVKDVIIAQDLDALDRDDEKRPLTAAIKDYMSALGDCYKKFNTPIADNSCRFFDRINDVSSFPSHASRSTFSDPGRLYLQASSRTDIHPDAKQPSFTGEELLLALERAYRDKTGKNALGSDRMSKIVPLEKTNAVELISEYMIKPCIIFVKAPSARQLESIFLLGFIVRSREALRNMQDNQILRVASRYSSCKLLLGMGGDLDKLAKSVLKAKKS